MGSVADTTPVQPARAVRPARRIDVLGPLTTVLAFVLAAVVGGILVVVSDPVVMKTWTYFFAAPGDALSASVHTIGAAYGAMGAGAVGGWSEIANTLVEATPLICGGLAVSLAFRAGLFNIGAQSQVIAGAVGAGYVGFTLQLPIVLHVIVALIAGVAAGAVWGGIAGLLKARTGAHEVIVTIMLNYVAQALLSWGLTSSLLRRPGRSDNISPIVRDSAALPSVGGVHLGFVLALAAAVLVWFLLNRTKTGFILRTVGANPDAARTAGMSVGRATTIAMLVSGGLAGLAGLQLVLGQHLPLTDGVAGTVGFDAITVALLGRGTPLGSVLAGLLFGALNAGGRHMQVVTQTPLSLSVVLQAVVVLFVAAPTLVREITRIRGRSSGDGPVLAKGWNS